MCKGFASVHVPFNGIYTSDEVLSIICFHLSQEQQFEKKGEFLLKSHRKINLTLACKGSFAQVKD
jgi:hypothetical protein